MATIVLPEIAFLFSINRFCDLLSSMVHLFGLDKKN
jgi:hypothetical protein